MNPLDFLSEFQAEASEKLDIIANQLLRLERDTTNTQPVREMFLAAHTIKGGAAMLRLTDVEALAHALEDLLTLFRDQDRVLDPGTADLLFQAIDMLRSLVSSAGAEAVGAELDAKVEAFAAQLRSGPAPVVLQTVAAASSVALALVVDESPTVRELLRVLLEESGYEVEVESNGDAALARAEACGFAVVVAGLELRGLHGFELATRLRAASGYATVPILLMSSDADAALAEKAKQAGATALLRKDSKNQMRLLELPAQADVSRTAA
jgi:chemotaxis protein histidine kinase CheA